jgi:hypothetical protein
MKPRPISGGVSMAQFKNLSSNYGSIKKKCEIIKMSRQSEEVNLIGVDTKQL